MARGGSQFNINLGTDMPQVGAPHVDSSYLARFQLQTEPKLLTGHTAFSAAFGSNLMMGEFALGGSSYILSALMESSKL